MSFSIEDLWRLIVASKLDIVEVREAILLYRAKKDKESKKQETKGLH